jgi:hypothetical protein
MSCSGEGALHLISSRLLLAPHQTAMTRKQNDREVITESDQILTSEALN